MLLEPPDPVVAHHATTFTPWRAERVELHPREPERPVAQQQHHLAIRARELRRQRIARVPCPGSRTARGQASSPARSCRPRGPRRTRSRRRRRSRSRRDRASRELRIHPHRVQRRARVLELRRARPRAARPPRAQLPIHASLASALPPAPPGRQSLERLRRARRSTPPPPGAGAARSGSATSITTISVSSPNAPPKPQAEVHRHAHHQRHVRALQRLRARAREEQLVVGGHAAARRARSGTPVCAASPPARAAPLAVPPVKVLPAMITGRSAPRRSSAAAFDRSAVRAPPRTARARPAPAAVQRSAGASGASMNT